MSAMRHDDATSGDGAARLHERAAVFFELLGRHDRAAFERDEARRARAATERKPAAPAARPDDRLAD